MTEGHTDKTERVQSDRKGLRLKLHHFRFSQKLDTSELSIVYCKMKL